MKKAKKVTSRLLPHVLRVCVLAEISSKFDWDSLLPNDDELCTQLYMDRLGHGVNGVAVTRPKR